MTVLFISSNIEKLRNDVAGQEIMICLDVPERFGGDEKELFSTLTQKRPDPTTISHIVFEQKRIIKFCNY